MLTVYTIPVPRPPEAIDLSGLPLDELVDAALAVRAHQTSAAIWFGYLEGFMLTPQEETQLRSVLRAFPCSVVCSMPLFLPHAWKMEVDTMYTTDPNGVPNSHDNGRPLHDGRSTGHDDASGAPASDSGVHQTGKARRSQAGRVQKGQDSTPRKARRPQANDGIRTQ